VTCLDCHEAAPDEADAFAHGGASISLLVTPKDCVGCHEVEVGQYSGSEHAASAVDPAMPGSWGDPATCRDCHGAANVSDSVTRNRLLAGAWPDRGTGRVNPDGSRGACTACHVDHAFDLSAARLDKTCRSCHSKGHQPTHAASAVATGIPELSAEETRSCATCHLGAGTRSVTHNPARTRKR
jgi:nitrate/TMAO reductase-like tetraheme cytochrome c subunit